MADQLTTDGVATPHEDTEHSLVESLHSRRTLLTGAAMGLGLAAAAVGSIATASPASAVALSQLGNGVGRNAPRADNKISLDGFNASADFAVQGTSSFSDIVSFARSGVISIGADQTSTTHTGVALTATSLVLANLQNHIHSVYVAAVVPNVSGSSFEIVLSRKVPSGMTAQVAWFIVN